MLFTKNNPCIVVAALALTFLAGCTSHTSDPKRSQTKEADGSIHRVAIDKVKGVEVHQWYWPKGSQMKDAGGKNAGVADKDTVFRYEAKSLSTGKRKAYAELDLAGNVIREEVYHLDGYLWIKREPGAGGTHLNWNYYPNGSPANHYVDYPNGDRTGEFFEENGKRTCKKSHIGDQRFIEYFGESGNLIRRRDFDLKKEGWTDTFYSAGKKAFQQRWDLMKYEDSWGMPHFMLTAVDYFAADGNVKSQLVPGGHDRLPRQLRTKIDGNRWEITYFRADGSPLAREVTDDQGKVLSSELCKSGKNIKELIGKDDLNNHDLREENSGSCP